MCEIPDRSAAAPDGRVVVRLETYADIGDALDAVALARFVDGSHPWAKTVHRQHVRVDATLAPADATSTWLADVKGEKTALYLGDGWTVQVARYRDRSAEITVTATTAELGARLLDEVATDVEEAPPPVDEAVRVGFWFKNGNCPSRSSRTVAVTPWADIRRNYSRPVGSAMTRVMALRPDDLTGRLLLFHGPPGTGKTTALRSLAHAWQEWCDVDYILDPETMLAEPSYLLSVALGRDRDEDDDDSDRWRLIVLEDSDELIHADAKQRSGQALGRLLNLTDGLLGHGLQLLVGITTNEPLSRLHPAVVRPGRCVAQVEVGRLSPAEARAWLGRPATIAPQGATLAELFAMRGELSTVEELAPAVGGGLYL